MIDRPALPTIDRPALPTIDRPAAPTIDARGAGRMAGLGLVTALGFAALLVRPALAPIQPSGRVAALAGLYALVAAGSLLVTVPLDRARLGRPATLAIGLVGVAAAAVAAGRPVAAPLGASALLLSLGAAVAEEALFRRAAYGWLARHGPAVAVAGSALLFALAHVPAYGVAALPVDLGAGLLLSWQRWASGTWTVPAATHAAANALAVMLR